MTFLDLLIALKREASVSGIVPTTTVGQTGEMKRLVEWIQIAHNSIQTHFTDWDFLWATGSQSVSARNVSKPSGLNVWCPDRFTINGTPIVATAYCDYIPPSTISTAIPTAVIIKPDGSLMFDTTPDTSYTFAYEYYRTPQILVNDADVPLIPTQFQYVIVGDALTRYANYEAAPELANQGNAIFQEFMRKLVNHQGGLYQSPYQQSESILQMVTY